MKRVAIKENLDYNCLAEDTELSFDVASNLEVTLTLKNVEVVSSINIDVADNTILHLAIFAKNPIVNSKITANIGENSKIIAYYADFTTEKNHLSVDVNLNKYNANCEWHLASLSSHADDKEIAVSIYHNHSNTFGRIDNYGVCKENSKLIFSGVSHIIKGCHQSASHQNAKIVVFDDGCKAIARPVLRIDENDIEASHAAVVGKVSDDHIFYLTSRGLNIDEAKLLITMGYLKPILRGFDDETAVEIETLIEGRL